MARNPKLVLDIQANVKQIQQTLSGLDTKIDNFGKKVEKGTGSASAGFAQFGLAVSGVQQAFGILDNTIGRVFRNVIEHGAGFEFAMDKVRGVLGDLGTDENMSKLTNQAEELGRSSMKSASEVAGLQFELSKLGFNADDIINATGAITNMGIAFDADLAQVAEVAGGTLRGFNMETEQTTQVADVMAKAFSISALDIDKFTNSMTYVAPVASQAGVTLEETTAILGYLANKSISGSMAGTALRSIFQQLADEGSDLAKKIGRPVVGFDDMTRAFKELQAQGQDLTSVLGFMDRRTAGVFANMIQDTDTIELMKDALEGSAGSAEALAQVMSDNLQGDMVELSSATEGFWIMVHKQLDPALRSTTQTMTEFVQGIDPEEIKSYALGLSIVATGFGIYKRQVILATIATDGFKKAMATSGVGALVIGLGLLIGAVIDFMDVFAEDTEALDANSDALERNRRSAEELATLKEQISDIDDPEKLRELVREREAVVSGIEDERKEWHEAGQRIKQYNEYIKTQDKTLFQDEEGHWRISEKHWDEALKQQEERVQKQKDFIQQIENGTALEFLSADNKGKALDRNKDKLQEELTIQQIMIANQGIQWKDFVEIRREQKKKVELANTEVSIIDLQIEKVEEKIDLEKMATKTTEERLAIILKISKLEQKQNKIVHDSYAKFLKMRERIDDDEFDKKINKLDDREERELKSLARQRDLNQAHINELSKMRDSDDTLSKAKRQEIQAQIEQSVKERTKGEERKAQIEAHYNNERKKVEGERVQAEIDANDEIVASRFAMGQKIKSQETIDFEAYIAHLDKRIEAEKMYSDEWFQMMEHREDVFDDHITKLNTHKFSGFQESLRLLNAEANAEETSAERKKEIQDRMAMLTEERLGRLRLGFKEFLKGELIDFLTAQQIKLFGKLAEILATGGATLGTSLAVSLPLYGAGIAMLEVAKNKVSAFAHGGVIDRPTMALMGEAGSELVIPEKGFKDYVREQIVPYQTDLIAQNLAPYNINQNFNQTLNQERMETLTALNTSAIQQMKDELGNVRKAIMLPQSMTISDGQTFASGSVSRGTL